ncbi:MAG: hypothetical protein IKI39_08775 [Oscillospiraceae bacterium]|nr:hypothetical protein [Oscillospiraceae bacterium]
MSTDRTRGASLRAALSLNAVFLALTVVIVRVGFESNDDPTLAAFVDGQMANSTAYVPYINIVLGALLKGIYTVLGREIAWHTFCQYTLLYLSFTALSFTLCERLGAFRGAAVTTVILLFFGVDVYCIINYTKTAAVCTVGGMSLLLYSFEREGRHPVALAFGVLLTVMGFLLRDMEFLPCFGLMAILCLRPLWNIFASKDSAGEKLRRFGRLVLPYALVVILCAGFYAVNEWAWSKEPWTRYHEFDRVRVAYSDYGRPAYAEMPEAYDALGLSEADVQLAFDSDYFDPDVFSAKTMRAITEARDTLFPHPSMGECVGLFLDKAVPGFFVNLHIYGLLLILALWLAAGEHSLRDWLCLALEGALFGAAYLYLIWRGRYLVDRVDLGLLLCCAAVMALMLDAERLKREKLLTVLVLLLAVGTSHYLMRDWYRSAPAEDRSEIRAAYERLLADEDHVYLAKLDAVTDGLWSPFEPYGRGYWDKIVLLGGFDCLHPTIMENLAQYGVENPFRDCVGNPKVYLIEDNIDLTLQYIHEHYDPKATAKLVEPLSTETGLDIYRILK